MYKINFNFILISLFLTTAIIGQDAKAIIQKSDDKIKGNTSIAQLKITSKRPNWSKEMVLKSWTKGSDYSVMVVQSPAKEKGTVFLKRKNEVWNYLPSISRQIKFPPSMMLQGWMGTDLTNDDLVKQSSYVVDYTHKLMQDEMIQGLECWKIELLPLEDADVVWGKVILWIDKKESMQMKAEFYDEDEFIINRFESFDIKDFDGRKLPAKMVFTPMEKEGNSTIIEYLELEFDMTIPEKYFTTRYMKRIR